MVFVVFALSAARDRSRHHSENDGDSCCEEEQTPSKRELEERKKKRREVVSMRVYGVVCECDCIDCCRCFRPSLLMTPSNIYSSKKNLLVDINQVLISHNSS